MPEWLKGPVSKTGVPLRGTVGSNPTSSAGALIGMPVVRLRKTLLERLARFSRAGHAPGSGRGFLQRPVLSSNGGTTFSMAGLDEAIFPTHHARVSNPGPGRTRCWRVGRPIISALGSALGLLSGFLDPRRPLERLRQVRSPRDQGKRAVDLGVIRPCRTDLGQPGPAGV